MNTLLRSIVITAFLACQLCVTSAIADESTTSSSPAVLGTVSNKPNILLIYSDDHGWADLGIQGADTNIRTPHLDQLAKDGVRFSRGYVSGPQCVPSRAGLITGRYQQKFGVEDNLKGPLPLSEITIAERLKPAGYVSGWVGKSHLDIRAEKGENKTSRIQRDHMPHRQGFDEYFRGEVRQYYASHDLKGNPLVDAPQLVHDDRFRVTVQTEAALSFLDRRATAPGQPWFLYLAWYAPHVPLESPEPWFSRTSQRLPLERRQALAMIAAMDDGIGQLREKLRTMGQEQNTLIFFIGDNGAPLKPGAWNGSLNTPLTGEKGMLTDGGVRVPFLAVWPKAIPSGMVYENPVINLDVAATVNAAAGLPPDDRLDGVDLLPYLDGRRTTAPHESLYWRWRSQAAVLEFPWKLIQLGEDDRFLFDVTHPDGELAANNTLAKRPEIAERLEERLNRWSATLQPPGPPEPSNAQDDAFYAAHVFRTADLPPKSRRIGDSDPLSKPENQGWIVRNGTVENVATGLIIKPDTGKSKNARAFITHSQLDLAAPVTAILRIRAKDSGNGRASITWRTKKESFAENQTALFDWPIGDSWSEVKVTLQDEHPIIHVRITPPAGSEGLELQAIEFRSKNKTTHFRFEADLFERNERKKSDR